MAVKSREELLEAFFLEVQANDPSLTDDSEGSKIDVIAGAVITAVGESQKTLVDEFRKTFIDTAHGPEVTGSVDDLENLLVDHWGDAFERPEPTQAIGVVTFSRATTDEGDVEILAGTIVKTEQNAAGSSQRFETIADVTMTGLSINASVRAIEAGPAGNVDPDTVTVIETALTDDSVVVTNDDAMSGGANTLTDAEYRVFARNLLRTLGGGSIEAIEAAAKTVPGVVYANGIEYVKLVKEWDAAAQDVVGDPFRVVRAVVYIGDANGEANDALIEAVEAAIEEVRAGGVEVEVQSAVAVEIDWTAELTLNASGPNYAELSVDPQPIIDSMSAYLEGLANGEDFIKADAEAYILDIWGASGSDDLTAISTVTPVGNVSVAANQKVVVGEVGVV